MSAYYMAMQQGVQAASLALGVESAETVAAYNNAFANQSRKFAAARARSAGERNIAAVNQDKIMSNTKIRQQQDAAEASARVSAALAGASGASTQAVIGQTQTTEVMAEAASKKAHDQQVENLKAGVFNATTQLNSRVRQQETTVLGGLLKTAASLDLDDLKTFEALNSDAGTLKIDEG